MGVSNSSMDVSDCSLYSIKSEYFWKAIHRARSRHIFALFHISKILISYYLMNGAGKATNVSLAFLLIKTLDSVLLLSLDELSWKFATYIYFLFHYI